MKYDKALYGELVSELNKVIAKAGNDKVIEFRNNVSHSKDQYVSFVWAMVRYIPNYYNRFIKVAYDNNMTDSHIETALKQALKQYR